MAGEGELDLEVKFPKFLADVLDKTEIIFEDFDSEVGIMEDHFLKFLLRCSRNFRTRIHLDNDNKDDWSLEMDNSQKIDRVWLRRYEGFQQLT